MVNTFRQLWDEAAEHYGDHPVVVSAEDGSRFSYKDVTLLVSSTISFLQDIGLRQGDAIIVHADNHPEYLFLLWASLQLGLVVVPVDYSTPVPLLKKIIDEVAPSLICCDGERLSRCDDGSTRVVVFDSQQGNELGDGRLYSVQIGEFIAAPVPSLPQLDGTELAVILFTSGSSGEPKGVMLSQGALCRSGALMSQTFGWSREDTLLSLGAMHVMSGLRNPALAALFSGTTILVAAVHQRTLALAVTELCEKYKVTVVTAVPAFLHGLIAEQQRWQPGLMRSVRMIMVTGTGLDQKSATKMAELIDTSVLNYYGLTETCGFCCYVPLHHRQQGDGVLGVVTGAEADVVDEGGVPVKEGETGELRIRSDNLMLGYMANPELSDRVLRDGWFYTGDLVQCRSDGMLYLMGRRDDRIKSRGGEIVYPDEVARSIQQYKGVINAAVCTVKTGQQQVELVAFVVLEEIGVGEEVLRIELRDWLLLELGTDRVPAQIVFCLSLPVGSSGKIDRKRMIQEFLSGK